MAINKQMFPQFRTDFAAAVAAVEQKYGVKLSLGTINYDANTFTSKMTAVSTDATAAAPDAGNIKWQANFLRTASRYGMKATDLGKEVTMGGMKYTLAGARPKADAPIVLRKPSGAYIAMPAEPVRQVLYGK